MDFSKIALFSDLDGTLFNSDRKVSQENADALRRFIAGGGAFGISTGRAAANARGLLPGVSINSWSVVLNGASAYHFSRKESGAVSCLPQAEMTSLLRWVLENLPQVNIQLCTRERQLLISRPEFGDPDFVATHQPLEETNLEDAMGDVWLKVLFCAPRPILCVLLEYAQSTGAAGVMDSIFTNEVYLEFLPRGVNKGSCLRALRQEDTLRGRTFVAVGDYTNDLELLREADVAVAVANALPEVKAVADITVCGNDEHAIAWLIDRVLPGLTIAE